jgi:hypothetical protein
VKLTGSLALAGRFGPWFTAHEVEDPNDLPGPICARLIINRQTGFLINLATYRGGSWLVGWYPQHRRCILDTHGCVWAWLPEVRIETHPVMASSRAITRR